MSPWGRRVLSLVLAVLASHPPSCGSAPQAVPLSLGGEVLLQTATVLDGDTLRLANGDRVRLLGVDTPETGQPMAQEATDFARAHVAGQPVRLVPDSGERDRYGRLLADVWVEGGSLSQALVRAGLAWVYRAPDPVLLALQGEAVEGRRGVHGGVGPAPGILYRLTKTSFHHPECRLPGEDRGTLPLEQNPGCLFKMGLSPCRRCLPWPPPFLATGG